MTSSSALRLGRFTYRVYGLRLSSDAPLPGLQDPPPTVPPGPPDIRIHWGRRPPEALSEGPAWNRIYVSEQLDLEERPIFVMDRSGEANPVFRMDYADGTRFWLGPGASEIWVTWPDAMTSEDASTYLLGPVLGYVLRLRGLHVLHASAVSVATAGGGGTDAWSESGAGAWGRSGADGAIAVVGPPGFGKSSTAAAFARRGHAVLTEDVCALCESGDPCRDAFGPRVEEAGAPRSGVMEVLPGYPLIRLWPDAVEMLYGSPEVLPLLTPTWEKRYLPLGEGGARFCDEPLPLRAIILLAPRESSDAPRLEPVPPAQALIQLVANTYKNLLLDRDQRVSEFRFLHRLLETVPVHRAVPHTDPAYMDALLDLMVEEV